MSIINAPTTSGPPVGVVQRLFSWLNAGKLPVLLAHAFLFVAVYSMLYAFGVFDHPPNTDRLTHWDAGLYQAIAQRGYDSLDSGVTAFFPFLPYLWRYLHLGPVGISILCALSALAGVSTLARSFGLTGRQVLVAASMPALVFTLVPYSEGPFFLFGSLFLVGLHRRNLPLTLAMLLLCCLTRAAATLFAPAYLFAELLSWNSNISLKLLVRNIVLGLVVMASAVGVVMGLQYGQTGDPLAFYKAQALWDHTYQQPKLPFYSTAGINVLWLDGVALLVAGYSGLLCLLLGLWWVFRTWQKQVANTESKAVLFSLGYCFGVGFYVVMFQHSDLANFNRYVLATPFLTVLLGRLWQLAAVNTWWVRSAALIGCGVVALTMGFPNRFDNFSPSQATWYFLLYTLYVQALLSVPKGSSPWYREVSMVLYVLNLVVLMHLLNVFLDGAWIG